MKLHLKWLGLCTLLLGTSINLSAAQLSLPDAPLFVPGQNIPPLVMLVMGRDHTLYYEAYNDATDLDGDDKLDTYFRPVTNTDGDAITYYGYFDSGKCYKYESSVFVPTGTTTTGKCKSEGGDGRWSGNFLNYLTTSRIDALRKVLYGGMRQDKTANLPVLERAYIPQDAHSWGKTWDPQIMNTAAKGNLLLSDYSDLDDSFGYLFANTTATYGGGKYSEESTNAPLLRVLQLTADMTPTKSGSVTSVDFSGTTNSWGKTKMTSIGGNKWQVKVSFTGGSSQRFKFVLNNETWLGDNDKDGKAAANEADIYNSVVGDRWVIFNANTYRYTLSKTPDPGTRIYVWNWVSKATPVAHTSVDNISDAVTPSDFTVRVRACVSGLLEKNCKQYGSNYFPVGLLQNYGEGEEPKMYFGLLTGSYKNNTKGGVLRAKIGKMDDEIDTATGKYKSRSGGGGIISTLDKLRVTKFSSAGNYDKNCGWITSRAINNGECSSWGNPIAEMIYESLRYFAGAKVASTDFTVGGGDELSLVEDGWDDPFAVANGHPQCAKPVNLVISDVGSSYDSDQVPGTKFGSYSGSLPTKMAGLNASTWTSTISTNEGVNGKPFFIGEVLGQDDDGVPTAKTITNLAEIRGLAPMEPTKLGSYYSAGLAYYGHQTDLNERAGSQKPQTVVVALASNLPKIQIRVGSGIVSLIPFAKSPYGPSGYTISPAKGSFQPTNGIVDFYVEEISPTEGTFRINYEDVEQGADHDMDMIVRYHYKVLPNDQLEVSMTSEFAAGGIVQHAGYVISGTSADGVYLDVRDIDTSAALDVSNALYYMDTVAATDKPYPNNARTTSSNTDALPLTRTRTFTASANGAAGQLPSPLWYAAKWGSFTDMNGNGIPETVEWDEDGDGEPDNYFLVTNANNLENQLKKALESVNDMARSATSVSYTASELTSDSQAFIATFEAKNWSGDLIAYPIQNGTIQPAYNWKANEQLKNKSAASRVIFTMDSDGSKRVFSEPTVLTGSSSGLSQSQITALLAGYPNNSTEANKLPYVKALVNYLRGDTTYEDESRTVPGLDSSFRTRNGPLGDNVHSTPVHGVSAGDGKKFVIFGANDGMVHVLDATNGQELFAYIPSTSYQNLYSLAAKSFSHKYFVDGTIKVVNVPDGANTKTIAVGTFGLGAQGAWALDLTNLNNLASTQASADSHLLWELTDSDAPQIGYIPNAPAIFAATDGGDSQWVAVFGNGYNASKSDSHADTTGEGALIVVDLLTGSVERTLLTGKKAANDPTGASRPNTVTEPVVADADLDGVGDYLYSGDLFGNVWKVDISGDSIDDWAFSPTDSADKPKPLFRAVSREGTAQPITVRPSVAHHPDGGLLVMVGTGKYVETSDTSVTGQATQSVYGLWDKPNRSTDITRNTLLEQTLVNQLTNVTPNQRETSKNAINWSQHDGWYLDLYYNSKNSGERINSRILITGTKASFTSMIPSDDICSGGGSGWYMEVDIYSGSNNGLVTHSMELERIPSEPTLTYVIDEDGDAEIGHSVLIDGGTIVRTPPTEIKTSLASWQMLY